MDNIRDNSTIELENTVNSSPNNAKDKKKCKIIGFQHGYFTHDLFAEILSGFNSDAKLLNWFPFQADFSAAFIAKALSDQTSGDRILGHLGFKLTYTLADNDTIYEKIVVLKSKARGHEVASWFSSLIPNLTPKVQAAWDQIIELSGFPKSDHKELDIAKIKDPIFNSAVPDIYWVWKDEENDIFVFAMEYLDRNDCVHSVNLSGWTDHDVDDVLHGLAVLHGRYFGNTKHLQFADETNKTQSMQYAPSLEVILHDVYTHCSDVITTEIYQLAMAIVATKSELHQIVGTYPMCLLHNDLWPQNFCYRKNIPKVKMRLCLYDWELAGVGPPQMDAAFFINLIHSEEDCRTFIQKYRDYLRHEVQKNNPVFLDFLDMEKFLRVYEASAMLLLVHLIAFYFMTWRIFKSTNVKQPFLNHLVKYIRSIRHKYSFLKNAMH